MEEMENATFDNTTIRVLNEKWKPNPNKVMGSRAHLTLGTAPGIRGVQTGLDLVKLVQFERENSVQSKFKIDLSYNGIEDSVINEFHTPGVEIHQVQPGWWIIYPEKSLQCQSLFTGQFTGR